MSVAVDTPTPRSGTHPVVLASYALIAAVFVLATQSRYGGWNDTSRLGMAEAIVERGHLWLDGTEMGRKSGDVCMIDGHYYSDKPPAVALLAVPVYAGEVALGLTFHANLPRAYYWTTLVTIGFTTLIGLIFLERFLRHFVPDPRWRALTILGLGLGTLNTVYTVTFSNHPPSATALLVGVLLIWAWRRYGAGAWTLAIGGFFVGLTATADHGAAFYVPFLLLYVGWPGAPRPPIGVLVLAASVAIPLAGYAAYAYVLSGSLLPLSLQPKLFDYPGSYFAAGSGHLAGSSLPHESFASFAQYVWLCTFGNRGLFSHTPILLLVIAGMVQLAFDRAYPRRAEIAVILAPSLILTLYYLLTSTDPGGNSYGVRWFCLFIPLLYVFLADAYSTLQRSLTRAVFWTAYALSFPLALIGTLDPWLDPTPYGTGYSWVIVLRAHGWL